MPDDDLFSVSSVRSPFSDGPERSRICDGLTSCERQNEETGLHAGALEEYLDHGGCRDALVFARVPRDRTDGYDRP